MIKFTKKFYLLIFFFLVGTAQASIITTDLTSDDYVSYKGLDWAWASPVNAETFGTNVLKLPGFHVGWRFATANELNILKSDLGLAAFTKTNSQQQNTYIQAVEYWNTEFVNISESLTAEFPLTTMDFGNGEVWSDWSAPSSYDTFYVRETPVPEPTTLMIFSMALIALALRKKVK